MSHQAARQDTMTAAGFMLGSVFFLSTMDVAIKQLVEHYSSIQVTFLRCFFSAILFMTWIALRNPAQFRTNHFGAHFIRAVLSVILLWSVGEAFRELPLADAYAIFFASPLLLALLSGPVMKEPAGPFRLAACGVGFLGVLIVLKPGATSIISYGSVMALLAVSCYAVVALMVRALGRYESSVTIAFWFSAIASIISGVLLWGRWQPLSVEHWGWVAVLVLTGTVGQVLIISAFRRASAAFIAPLDYTHMPWAVFYGWLFWDQLPDARTWFGTFIIIAAGTFVIYREHRAGLARRKAEKELLVPPL